MLPKAWLNDQVTAVFDVPETDGVNCSVPVSKITGLAPLAGVSATLTPLVMAMVAEPETVPV